MLQRNTKLIERHRQTIAVRLNIRLFARPTAEKGDFSLIGRQRLKLGTLRLREEALSNRNLVDAVAQLLDIHPNVALTRYRVQGELSRVREIKPYPSMGVQLGQRGLAMSVIRKR